MWLFSSKSSDNSTSASGLSSVLGSHGADDPLSSYVLLQPSAEEFLPGPFDLRWTRRSATSQRKPGDRVTIFSCQYLPKATTTILLQAVKRMKTLRHPNILNWLAGSEQPKAPFHIITEEVCPLRDYIREHADSASNFTFLASWGIYQITRALAFLNDDCQLSHNAVCVSAVYVNRSGEWKVGRLDYITPLNEASSSAWDTYGLAAYSAPKGHWVDAWGLACLIWEIFNPEPLKEASQLSAKTSLERLPRPLVTPYRRLLSTRTPMATSRGRSPFKAFLKVGFFHNDYINTLLFLEEIQLKEKEEKSQFLAGLGKRAVGLFPDDICRYKILPHLVNSLQFGSAGVEALVPVLELAHLLSDADFEVVVVPGLVRLFAAPDRATRVRLLDQLPRFVDKLPRTLVESQIFGPVSAGFTDANPLVREATIRAMVHLAPSLPSKILNDTLIRHLTSLEFKDEQGGIRTNATICLAKLASRLDPGVRRGPLLNAFLRATRDPFPPSRQAAVTGLAACQAFFSAQDLAGKVIPCLSFVAVDTEKDIRDTALKALRGMVERLEKASEDPSVGEADTSVVGGHTSASGVATVAAAGGKLTAAGASFGNWALTALSSISSRLISSYTPAAASQQTPSSAPGASSPSVSDTDARISGSGSGKPTSPSVETTEDATPIATKSTEYVGESAENDGEVKQKKKAIERLWDDLDDEDDEEAWAANIDKSPGFSSFPTTVEAELSEDEPKQQIVDLLVDWEDWVPMRHKEQQQQQQKHQMQSQIIKASSLSPSPKTSIKGQKTSTWEEKSWNWTEDKAEDWNATNASKSTQRVKTMKASSLSPSLAPARASTSSGGDSAWERERPVVESDKFFEELLGPRKKSDLTSAKTTSVFPDHRSTHMEQSKKSLATESQMNVINEDTDGWDDW